ncbi:hypothetical protein B0J13DRAFT_669031 [Dactylonectria estremocensis]|uniref:Uncharacterized protein n=1 Tax=Dactylonectria estremocensis TaxID=1079267 RepID=A0A9P9FHK8_9HYPO|nr:hypothetical protein B0J13DRAFT_669031 [Dactylonectria estremocensis]
MDPFTAVTSAAGLASLGITICDGFLTYCCNYRAGSDDGAAANSALKLSINECLGACELCLQELGTFSTRHSQTPPNSTLKSHGKSMIQRLQCPFERNMVEFFRQQMQEFQFALSTQILLLIYDLTTNLSQKTLAESSKIALAISALETIRSIIISSVSRH